MTNQDRLRMSRSDCKLSSHAINWVLNVPFDNTDPPNLSSDQRERLQMLMERLLTVIHGKASSVELTVGGEIASEQSSWNLSRADIDLLEISINAFSLELFDNPTEIEIVTGLPSSLLGELKRRIAALSNY